ncbi:hypothetical protein LshimejAT787_1402930 [Lyophyllum shimeji]|uniref:Uncharacterized protein n=1 Tax=Lyophyllum shimeji TaxID=47721 RepID=A0A9P3UV47_LYOSH|nr:hypothetical protein LshimejAT787_1402930 [Lyophyllum shimeji]
MPFFQGASGVNIHGGDFKDIAGDHNIYHSSSHNENSGNTTSNITTNSNNDSSVRMGATHNNNTARTHSGPKYSAKVTKGEDQDHYYRQKPASESGYATRDRYHQEELARRKVATALRPTIEQKPAYNAYGIFNQDAREEEYAWQPSNAQPQRSSSGAQSEPLPADPVSQSFSASTSRQQEEAARQKVKAALRMASDRRYYDPYGTCVEEDGNPWFPTAQQEPSLARAQSDPFAAPHTSLPEALSSSPPPPMKSKNPFLNLAESQGGQAPTSHKPLAQ